MFCLCHERSVMGVASPPLGDSFSLPTAGMRTRPGVWHRTNTPPSVNTGNHSSLVQIAASRRNGVGQGSSRVGNYISPVLVKMASMDKKNRFIKLITRGFMHKFTFVLQVW